MKIIFHGAAGIVTGSCFEIITKNSDILVDCGMFQGSKETTALNYQPLGFDPKKISHIILTHAHIDHSGLIPKAVNEGFKGKVFCTSATKDVAKFLLEDSGSLQESDEQWRNKRLLRQGLPERKPLYTKEDATRAARQFVGKPYDKPVQVTQDITIVFRDAGHVLGSSFIEMQVMDGSAKKKLVFSGDLGQWDKPLIKDPEICDCDPDYVFVESTYGDRVHEDVDDRKELFFNAIMDTYKRGGRLIIPSFALERTQELIYYLNEFAERGRMPKMPVFIDSPLAISLTELFKAHPECLDEEALGLMKGKDNPLNFPGLQYLRTADESRSINSYSKPCIIIAGSGMCNGGRVRHHLKHSLWSDKNTLLFVGYQAEGTLGRIIQQKPRSVRILDEYIAVKAKILTIGGFSAHADQPALLKWLGHFAENTLPKKVFIIHGEPKSQQAFAAKLKQRFKFDCAIPKIGDSVTL